MKKIILASRSPARRLLMKELNVPFECHSSDYPEDMNAFTDAKKLARFLAEGKASHIAHRFLDSVIIGADTFVMNGAKKVGKPVSREDAVRMVRAMSGRTIKVYTGVAVVETDGHGNIVKKRTSCVVTKLKIKKMSEEEVRLLAYQKDALEISGSFSIEGEGGKMVEKIEGDYQNVIGLPMFKVFEMLQQFGF